jgi:polyvinyl alcohol dehydrogenase (cytochrome)
MNFIPTIALLAAIAFNHSFEPVYWTAASADSVYVKMQDSTMEQGKKIFIASCYSCHKDSANTVAPGVTILSVMTPKAIYASLNTGKMRQQGSSLSEKDKRAVAEWIAQRKMSVITMPDTAHTKFQLFSSKPLVTDHSGWGNDIAGSGFRTADQAGISTKNISSIRLKWAFAFPDATLMRSKPAVIDNWIIIGSQYGEVYALNRLNGKIGWMFTASAAIRGAITVSREANSIIAYFTDFSTNTYAVDVKTGKLLWNKRAGFEYLSSTTGSVAVYNGIVYVPITTVEVSSAANGNYDCCSSSGGVVALNAKSGEKLWVHRVIGEKASVSGKKKNGKAFYGPSGAPVWSSPTVDAKRGLLYIGTGENYTYPTTTGSDAIQALDLKTGKLVWNFQATENDAYNTACPMFVNCPEKSGPDLDFGMAPILVRTSNGKDILVAGQKSGVVHALSPDDGKIIWQTRIGKGGMLGGIHWGMATDGKYVYAANADNPLAIDRRDSTIKSTPGLYALDLLTGSIVWKAEAPPCPANRFCINGNSAAPLAVPGIVFAGSLDGHMRAYSSENGTILWDFDTATEFRTVNGITGRGGSIDGPAAVIAGGMLLVNSGYGMFGQKGGNVLLAFECMPLK